MILHSLSRSLYLNSEIPNRISQLQILIMEFSKLQILAITQLFISLDVVVSAPLIRYKSVLSLHNYFAFLIWLLRKHFYFFSATKQSCGYPCRQIDFALLQIQVLKTQGCLLYFTLPSNLLTIKVFNKCSYSVCLCVYIWCIVYN